MGELTLMPRAGSIDLTVYRFDSVRTVSVTDKICLAFFAEFLGVFADRLVISIDRRTRDRCCLSVVHG